MYIIYSGACLNFIAAVPKALEELRMKRVGLVGCPIYGSHSLYLGTKVVNMETEERLQAVMNQKHELELRLVKICDCMFSALGDLIQPW